MRATLTERVVEGKRLGRHIHHDPRSRLYRERSLGALVQDVTWQRSAGVLDQGDLGSCTANALVGVLKTSPFYETLPSNIQSSLTEDLAVDVYKQETREDPYPGVYPPDDTGSDGLTAAKVGVERGWLSGYTHGFSLDEMLGGLQSGPGMFGTLWLTDMDSPSSSGLVHYAGTVRGGHEIECFGVDAANKLVWFWNSWGDQWGLDGKFCMSFSDVAAALGDQGDVTFPKPKSAPAPQPDVDVDILNWWHSSSVWAQKKHIGGNKAAAAAARLLASQKGLI